MVDIERECIDDIQQPLGQVGIGKTLPQRVAKHLQIGVEGVLVHRVDGGEVCQHKEEDGSSSGGRPIAVSNHFNLFRSLLSFLELFDNLQWE